MRKQIWLLTAALAQHGCKNTASTLVKYLVGELLDLPFGGQFKARNCWWRHSCLGCTLMCLASYLYCASMVGHCSKLDVLDLNIISLERRCFDRAAPVGRRHRYQLWSPQNLEEERENRKKLGFECSINSNTVGKHSHSLVFVYVCVVSDSSAWVQTQC